MSPTSFYANVTKFITEEEHHNVLKTLKKQIREGQIIVAETDKIKRFAILSPSQYLASGAIHTNNDMEISPNQIKRIQTTVNDHLWWFKGITNVGSNWKHEDRMAKNLKDKGEQSCNMVLLIKDHKKWSNSSNLPPPSRPVVSGNMGLNCHLSEMLSSILEPITSDANGSEIDSTTEMLARIKSLNSKMSKIDGPKNEYIFESSEPIPKSGAENVNVATPDEAPKKSKVPRGDIRFYGVPGKKSNHSTNLAKNVEKLRDSKIDGLLPNIADRVKAGYLVDVLEGGQPIKAPTKKPKKSI